MPRETDPSSLCPAGRPVWCAALRLRGASCPGYYDHDKGHVIPFQGRDAFRGKIIHPQQWELESADFQARR